jgi:hypothetical protein
MGELPDGTLYSWAEIAEKYDWQTLLIGNGLSRHIWEPFGYPALFNHASAGGLSEAERELFDATPNFERVLGDLLTSIRVCEVLGMGTTPLYESYQNIQLALGQAVRDVHINRDSVPMGVRLAIREVMKGFEWIFTTNYDLLIYWAMACTGRFAPFIDHFRYGGRLEFDPLRVDVFEGQVPVHFLHGALHLVVDGAGQVFKLRRGSLETLLDQFGEPIEGDPEARPLLVTEGSAEDKLEVIESNEYLTFALEELADNDLDTVVFGSGLGAEDGHIAAALSENPDRTVAVSMLPGDREDLHAQQTEVFGRVEVEELLFYDATTHPLGAHELRVQK